VPERVDEGETGTRDGVDYTYVMQLTFLITILAGVPLVVVLSLFVTLPTWTDRAEFVVRVGALLWLVTGTALFLRERRRQ